MHRNLWRFGLAALVLVMGCATLPKTMKGFEDVTKEIQGVTVMPPAFTLEKVGAFTAQAQSDMTHDIEMEILATAERLVDKSTYDLAALAVSDSVLAGDPDLRQMLFEQSQEHQVVSKKIAQTKGKTIDIGYAANIDYFADKTGAEYFLFLDGGGWFKTGGAVAKDVAISAISILLGGGPSGGPGSSTSLQAFLVDAKRGKVIWYNAVTIADRDPRKPSHLQKTCQKLMSPLLGDVKFDYENSRDDEIIKKYKPQEEQKQSATGEK